jgi:hypothetical protein
MAGEYGSYVASHPSLAAISSSILHSSATDALPPAARGAAPRAALPPRLAGPVPVMPCPPDVFGSGPQALVRWVSHWDECFRFRPDFLVLWGARCAIFYLLASPPIPAPPPPGFEVLGLGKPQEGGLKLLVYWKQVWLLLLHCLWCRWFYSMS